jgi:hypothetical protein
MNIKEWIDNLNFKIEEAKRISEKFPSVDIHSDEDGFGVYHLKNPTENELLQATICLCRKHLSNLSSRSINTINLKLYYDEPGIYVEILDTCLNDYKSLEDFANTICPSGKFLEKLKLLISSNKFDEINKQMVENG